MLLPESRMFCPKNHIISAAGEGEGAPLGSDTYEKKKIIIQGVSQLFAKVTDRFAYKSILLHRGRFAYI